MPDQSESSFEIVPDSVIPAGTLPPLRYRDLPLPVPLRRMLGPSVILAGLALGSGEFVLWPYLTYKSGFVFFWACVLGVITQYFLNMEVTRWSLATGESAITGFVRLNRNWAWAFLLLNIIPWMIPAWATGAAELLTWMYSNPQLVQNDAGAFVVQNPANVTWLAIAGMVGCGTILTAGPVVYETVEKIQIFLVGIVIALIAVLAIWMVRWESVVAQVTAVFTLGYPDFVPSSDLTGMGPVALLGALAFAGAGGTTNLGQSNYIKDKGYGMGKHIGRITSPITGQLEAVAEIGYHFRDTEENRSRWSSWWRSASIEHLLSFFLTCLVCLVLLTLITHSVFYEGGQLREGADRYGEKMNFILGEATEVGTTISPTAKTVFLVMGIAILLTTEFGVLDACSRISTDIVKVSWLRENPNWSEGRLYFFFLWGTILLGSIILLLKEFEIYDVGAFELFTLSAAMNGGVMFLYSGLLLYVNRWRLPKTVRMSGWRVLIMVWAVLFFGVFAIWAAWFSIGEMLG